MSQIQLDVVEEREESLNLSYPSGLVVFVLFQTSFMVLIGARLHQFYFG